MKLLKKDLKHGNVKVAIETADDLWYLYTIIEPGDRCTGQSEYKYKLESSGKTVKKKVWVAITVEKTELTQQLRVSGVVVDGSEEVPRGSHHTLDGALGYQMEIRKKHWLDYHLEKVDDAVNSANLKTLLVLFDREVAVFAMLKPNGYEKLLELKGDVPKKGMDEGKTHSFYKQIVAKLEEYTERYGVHRTIAASPSFWKEYLRKELGEFQKKVIFAAVSSAEEAAIPELLKRPELKQALEGERTAREEAIVEELMEALGKERLVYGLTDVQEAVAEGNVTTVTVTENEVMKRRVEETFAELEALMKQASSIGAKIHLLSTDVMQKIDGLGGVAAMKRW